MRRFQRLMAYREGAGGMGRLRAAPRHVVADYCAEHFTGGSDMFELMEVGMVVVVEAISFPYVGEVVAFGDGFVTLKNSVKVLWDGRHHQYVEGKPPGAAEIENTFPLFTLNVDAIIGWGPYPCGKIPKQQ